MREKAGLSVHWPPWALICKQSWKKHSYSIREPWWLDVSQGNLFLLSTSFPGVLGSPSGTWLANRFYQPDEQRPRGAKGLVWLPVEEWGAWASREQSVLSTGGVLLSSDDLGVQCGRFCVGPLVAWELRSPYSCICCELGSCGFNVNVRRPLEEPPFQLWGSHGDSDLQAHLVCLSLQAKNNPQVHGVHAEG